MSKDENPSPSQHVAGIEPDEWQYFCDGKWRYSTNPTYHRDTGYPMRPLYAHPPSPSPNLSGREALITKHLTRLYGIQAVSEVMAAVNAEAIRAALASEGPAE
jgi:hypothetical protein